jgi:hypothetical protein
MLDGAIIMAKSESKSTNPTRLQVLRDGLKVVADLSVRVGNAQCNLSDGVLALCRELAAQGITCPIPTKAVEALKGLKAHEVLEASRDANVFLGNKSPEGASWRTFERYIRTARVVTSTAQAVDAYNEALTLGGFTTLASALAAAKAVSAANTDAESTDAAKAAESDAAKAAESDAANDAAKAAKAANDAAKAAKAGEEAGSDGHAVERDEPTVPLTAAIAAINAVVHKLPGEYRDAWAALARELLNL